MSNGPLWLAKPPHHKPITPEARYHVAAGIPSSAALDPRCEATATGGGVAGPNELPATAEAPYPG